MLSLRREEQGTQKLFVDTSKIPDDKWRFPLMEEECQASYQAAGVVNGESRTKS